MDDRFKFKGMDIQGRWFIGNLAIVDEKYYISNGVGRPLAYQVRPETICQCTGLKDCNEKLIFEGDTFEKGGNLFSIEWYDGGFIIQGKDDFQVFNESSVGYYDIAITGNIHEVDNAKAN